MILDKRRRKKQREERIEDDFDITPHKYKFMDRDSWCTKCSYVVRKNIVKTKAFDWFIMGAIVINSMFMIFEDPNYDNANYDPDEAGDSQTKQDVQSLVICFFSFCLYSISFLCVWYPCTR